MKHYRKILIWIAVAGAIAIPLAAAAMSPQLAWRGPIYIVAGFAGIVSLALLLIQPLLIGGYLPSLSALQMRRAHKWVGILLVTAILVHVIGLWLTSPPDVIDALLFRSPTPFSVWGVVAMWAIFAAALLGLFKVRLRWSPRIWRMCHTLLAVVTVVGTIVHAMLIEGTMETLSKAVLCLLVGVATLKVVLDVQRRTKKQRR